MIERNRHAAGKLWNAAFGAAQVLDGLVRLISCGTLHTRLTLEVSRQQAQAVGKRIKRSRAKLRGS